jgi:hypothetical protein
MRHVEAFAFARNNSTDHDKCHSESRRILAGEESVVSCCLILDQAWPPLKISCSHLILAITPVARPDPASSPDLGIHLSPRPDRSFRPKWPVFFFAREASTGRAAEESLFDGSRKPCSSHVDNHGEILE